MESKSGRVLQYATRVALSAPGKFLLAVAVMVSLVSIPLPTKAGGRSEHGRNGHDQNEQRTLTGNWMVTVTRVNPPPSLPPTFLSLMTYFEDGNFLEESNTTAIRSTHRGDWERIWRRQFARVSVAFRFDAARTYLGTGRITATLTLSEDGSQFQAEAVLENFDPSGNLLTTAQSTEVGQRL
ncbi:MAG: hypothetical protein ABIQ35_00160 [Verrucomicrobiota bacterium]